MSEMRYYTDFASESDLDSTAFRQAWYDAPSQRLYVEWYNGTITGREQVSPVEWHTFRNPSVSAGNYWYLHFKDDKPKVSGNLDDDHFSIRPVESEPEPVNEFVVTFEITVRSAYDFKRVYARAVELADDFSGLDVEVVGIRKR